MVLVTGATGLIGSYLILELSKRGISIRAMKRTGSSLDAIKDLFIEFLDEISFTKIEWVDADILDISSMDSIMQGIETVYHAAASVGMDDRDRKIMHEINVTGTENLVNLAISEKIKNFVHISSIATLDITKDGNFIDESSNFDQQKNHSEYAISKRKSEMVAWRGSQEGLNVLVVLPSVVIGSQNGKRASEKIFILSSKKRMFASKGQTGYVDVRDVAFAMVELAKNNHWNQRYLLHAENKSFEEVMNYLRNKWGLKRAITLSDNKLKLIQLFSQISRLMGGPYMSQSSYEALTGKAIYSSLKVQNELNFNFRTVEESLDFHANRFKNTQ